MVKGDDSGQFDPNRINDKQQTEPLTDLKTPPQNTDNLDNPNSEFPDGDDTTRIEPTKDFTNEDNDLPSNVFDSSQPSDIPRNFTTGEPLIGPGYPGGDAGTVSEIPPLHDKTLSEVDRIINDWSTNAKKTTDRDWITYEFPDGSRIDIRNNNPSRSKTPNGRVTRSPASEGLRYRIGEGVIQTKDANGNRIPGAHDTNEFVKF